MRSFRSVWTACVVCGNRRSEITVDLPEGDVCASCVIELVARLRKENARLKKAAQHVRKTKRTVKKVEAALGKRVSPFPEGSMADEAFQDTLDAEDAVAGGHCEPFWEP